MKVPPLRLLAGTFVLALAGCGTLENAAPPPPTAELFAPAPAAVRVNRTSQICRRSRVVAVDRGALPGEVGRSLRARLFDDTLVTLELEPVTHHPDGSRSWTGHVVGEPLSYVILVGRDQVFSGSLACAQGSFDLRWLDGDQVEVRERPSHAPLGCGVSPTEPHRARGEANPMTALPNPRPRASRAQLGTSALNVVDIYVVYNERTVASLGSVEAVRAKIVELVEYANMSYENSQAEVRLNLLGGEEVSYTQASNTDIELDDVDALANYAAGPFASERAALGADLMSVLLSVDPVGEFTSGIADLPRRSPGLSRNLAFSAVAVEGSAGVLAHEVGHNFGCQHDLATPHAPPDQALYPFGYGHRRPGVWATVMAYPQGDEVRIPLFSNPFLTLEGVPTGIEGVSENWRALSRSAPVMAAYQTPAPTPQPTPTPGQFTVSLNSGWTAVAFQTQTVTSLSGNSAIASLATFDGTSYATASLDTATVNSGDGTRRGMFVFATAPTSFSYNGGNDSRGNFVNLKSGWNLCAFVSTTEVPGSALRAQVDGTDVALGSAVLPQFQEIQPGAYTTVDVSAGGQLKPGRACWVYAFKAARLSW